MWRASFLLGLIAVIFVVVMFTRHDSDEPKPKPETSPPGYMLVLGQLTTPFAPKLDLGISSVKLVAGQKQSWTIPRSADRARVATFTLQQGHLVYLIYCPSGTDCSHDLPVCLIPERSILPQACRPLQNPGPKASVAVTNVGGDLTLSTFDPAGVVKIE